MSKETVLRRYRKCAVCDLAASENTELCAECLADEEYRLRIEAPVANFEACGVCGGELRRGHCYDCVDRDWSAAQVREAV